MSSAICSNFDQSKILSSGNGLKKYFMCDTFLFIFLSEVDTKVTLGPRIEGDGESAGLQSAPVFGEFTFKTLYSIDTHFEASTTDSF